MITVSIVSSVMGTLLVSWCEFILRLVSICGIGSVDAMTHPKPLSPKP